MGSLPVHSFEPICDNNSRLLILGSMPSPASIAAGMYYSHPRNAFWRIMRDITGDEPGSEAGSRRLFLLRNGIALWDTLSSCEREGAYDSNIREETPNEIFKLVSTHPKIAEVFLNGGAALKFYKKYHAPEISLPYYALPSTSPANARGGYEKKLDSWQILKEFLYK